MDRSFLTNRDVVEASRDFVCIRVATYENESEAEFMKSLYTRNGTMENTTFAMLAPDGKTKLSKASRGPHGRTSSMVQQMNKFAKTYPATNEPLVVPAMQSVDLALNVAACDNLPLVVVSAKDQTELKSIEDKLINAVWSPELRGQFVYARTTNAADLKILVGKKYESGVMVVMPGNFGLMGQIYDRISADTKPEEFKERLQQAAATFKRTPASHNEHVKSGIALHIEWKTKLPETDAQSVRAKNRARGR